MKRFLALAALFAVALAGQEYGDGSYYNSPTAIISSFVAAPPQPSTTQMANVVTSSMTTPTSTSMAGATTSSTGAAPSLITLSLVATPTAAGLPKSPAATHTVLVGGSSLTYTPLALSGVKDKDTIIFLFFQMNHTLTQSSFALPCNKSDGGFKSGFLPSNGNNIPFVLVEFSDPMNTGSPLWFYCGQANHCQRGMRFSINAPNQKDMAWRAIDTVGGSTATSAVSVSTPWSSSAPSASIVPGMGTMNNGQCSCDCLCGVNAFPLGDGIGMIGGMPGMIPAASAPSMAGPTSSSPAYGSGWK